MTLLKACLLELNAESPSKVIPETKVEVQFNPTSMRLQRNVGVSGGETAKRQPQQWTAGSDTLSLDLEFDTADEGTTAEPVDVRTKTARVAKFVLPPEADTSNAPPRVHFNWGSFIFEGVMDRLIEELDFFSDGGVPLRAKVSISIRGQDPKFIELVRGPGRNRRTRRPAGGQQGAGPGSTGGGPTDRTATAVGGESAADFARRAGLDPAAWRSVAQDLDSTLSLPAGLEIDFASDLPSAAGLGVTVELEAGVSASLEASLGLEADAGAVVGGVADDRLAAGFALAAAGGVAAAAEITKIVSTESAAAAARASFEAPSGAPALVTRGLGSLPPGIAEAVTSGLAVAATSPAGPAQPRPPLARPSTAATGQAPRSVADPRATSFGFGVPLQPRVSGPADDRPGAVGWVTVGRRPRGQATPETRDPTTPPWATLPAAAGEPAARQRDRRCPCGCGGTRGGAAPLSNPWEACHDRTRR
jgi:hypothetical protein